MLAHIATVLAETLPHSRSSAGRRRRSLTNTSRRQLPPLSPQPSITVAATLPRSNSRANHAAEDRPSGRVSTLGLWFGRLAVSDTDYPVSNLYT